MVQVGLGSQIIPNNDQDIILVGGDFENNFKGLAVMQNSGDIMGNIVYKGSKNGNGKIWTNGDIRRDSGLDLSKYEDNLEELKVKSQYWSTIHVNGKYTPYSAGPNGNTALFEAGDDECVQVFHLSNDEFNNLPWGIHVQFHSSLQDKTVLINMASDNSKTATVTNLANFIDPWGMKGWDFNTGFIANILWNFYDAEYVDLGGGTTGTGEFTGSIIVPNGGLKMGFPGQSGRTIVGGDLTQERGGSEFHSFPYDPVCALPLPPCTSDQTNPPTKAPTRSPTKAPTSSPTKIPTPEPTPAPIEIFTGGHPGYIPLGGPSTTSVGVTQPNGNPIVVGEQICTEIGFGVTNQWGTNIDYIFVQHKHIQTGTIVCEAFKDVSTNWFATFSASCMKNSPVSIVTVTVVDSSFSTGDSASLLKCCGDNEILGEIAGTMTEKIVRSSYVLDCCPEKAQCI
jgi:choice-of-anchor A domain-containing protein